MKSKNVETIIDLSYFNSCKRAKKEFIDVSQITNIGNLKVINESMQHKGISYANGYKIKENDISIGLTGDATICEGVKNLAAQVDYLISDVTLEEGDDSHMGINNLLELLKENPNLKVIPIHMQDKTKNKLKEQNLENLIILEDGDILEI